MGIYLSFALSNSVTQSEWEKVYEESLFLAKKLDFADWSQFSYKGINLHCFCKVKEHKELENGEKVSHWRTSADYSYMSDAEEFWLCRKLRNKNYDKNAGAAILNVLPYCTKHDKDEAICNQAESYWGNKTQGYIYHAYLLGIACMMETRLKDKVFIYGDIKKEHCEFALDLINQFAKEPVDLPARCDFKRLYELVKPLEISDEDKLLLMEDTYLDDLDFDCGELIRKNFDKDSINLFWKNKFDKANLKNNKYNKALSNYIALGFDFNDLFSFLSSYEENEYKDFISAVIEVKNENDSPIKNQFDEMYETIEKNIGDKIDVKKTFDEKLKDSKAYEENSFIATIKKHMADEKAKAKEYEEKYDIYNAKQFITFEKGQTFSPVLLENLKNTQEFITKILEEQDYKDLLQKKPDEQIKALIELNQWFPVRDIDWIHAIDYFENHTDALSRYYPLFRMEIDHATPYKGIAQALFINDAFYEFFKELPCSD